MEKNIDREIMEAEATALKHHNLSLLKQNELLKQQLQQIKDRHKNMQKELTAYKRIAFDNIKKDNKDQVEILQMQHSRIFELESELQLLKNKYNKVVKANSSSQQTDYAVKCKQYERRMRESELQYQKQISVLREKLMKSSANEIVESKRLVSLPNDELKKSSLAVRKFV